MKKSEVNMLIYNLINNSSEKKWKKITSNVCTYKKKSYLCIDFERTEQLKK